jgi:coronin-1B/1C/6
MLPKRAVNVSECEIVRMLKVGTKTVEPIAFNVPRKSDLFQDDIFPDCYAGEPALSASEWLGGSNAEPKTVSLQGGFVKKDKPQSINFEKVAEAKPLSEKELKEEVEKLTKRVSYLESELIKRDARIKELETK